MRPHCKILAVPDAHIPFEDKRAVKLCKAVARQYKPDIIVVLGDFIDCLSISAHSRSNLRALNLKKEIEGAARQLDEFRQLADKLVFLEGNHCFRLDRYLATRAPELFGLVTIPELLDIDKSEFHPYRSVYKQGLTHFSHDYGYAGKGATRQAMEAYGGSIVQGHTHRSEIVYDRNLRGEGHFGMSCGWLGSYKDIDYLHSAQTRAWTHGCGLIDQDASGRSFASFVPFVGNKASVHGHMVSV